MYMLIDCDNFFVSCEKAFQPRLKNQPIVVLSNNDGCVVSRSYEAKALGIAMCAPFFKIENLLRLHNGIALSSNYELYADMSRRVMALIKSYFSNIEIYSIDEAFVSVDDREQFEHIALTLRNTILQQTGISVSIGIAKTKTLCKIASEIAKKQSAAKICLLTDPKLIQQHLSQLDVKSIWGVGNNITKKLNFLGIFTAWELASSPLKMIRNSFSISLEKTVMELNNTPCLEMEEASLQQSIICSRSFEYEVNNFENLQKIISEFVDNACLRLREQNGSAKGIVVFISTNRFKGEQYDNSHLVSLPCPTNHTAKFIKAMIEGLTHIYEPKYQYKKAGIILTDIESNNAPQRNFFDSPKTCEKDQKLMQTFDEINHKLGRKTIYFGTQGAGVSHYIKREFKSTSYTTSWDGLPVVK